MIMESISEDFDIEEIEITQELDEEIEIDTIEIEKPPEYKAHIVEEKSLIEEIGLQWIAIFLLALIGLVSSIYSRRKLLRLENRQKNLTSNQDKIESEIQNLGVEENG